jgi:ferredoxin
MKEERSMRVVVDEFRCDAHGVCVDSCPEVFALSDEDDVVTVLNPEPDEALRASVVRAADVCPKAAITVED